jgi:hypothetical protein
VDAWESSYSYKEQRQFEQAYCGPTTHRRV